MAKKRSTNIQGPQFTQYFNPVIVALNELGGSGRPEEVVDRIVSLRSNLSEYETELVNGTPRITKNIHWARFYLTKAGYIDGSSRGVWLLTEKGRQAKSLTQTEVREIFSAVREEFGTRKSETDNKTREQQSIDNLSDPENLPEQPHYRELLIEKLLNLSPGGFEVYCQYLLRKAGFSEVTVTGRPGDGGIDGHGILKINPFVSMKVAFQCKRYSGSVGAEAIRNFRGSIMGRADKGIIMTTGSFTPDASREAIRDGAIPIELVDREKLFELIEMLELGLKKVTTYAVEEEFFEKYGIK